MAAETAKWLPPGAVMMLTKPQTALGSERSSRRTFLRRGLRAGTGLTAALFARENAAAMPWPLEEGLEITDVGW